MPFFQQSFSVLSISWIRRSWQNIAHKQDWTLRIQVKIFERERDINMFQLSVLSKAVREKNWKWSADYVPV